MQDVPSVQLKILKFFILSFQRRINYIRQKLLRQLYSLERKKRQKCGWFKSMCFFPWSCRTFSWSPPGWTYGKRNATTEFKISLVSKNPGKTLKSTRIYFLFIYPVLPTGRLFGRITQTESTEKVCGSEICARILAEFPKNGWKGAELSCTDLNLTYEFS